MQAMDKRDSFAKSIYVMIFNWLVEKINTTILAQAGTVVKGEIIEISFQLLLNLEILL